MRRAYCDAQVPRSKGGVATLTTGDQRHLSRVPSTAPQLSTILSGCDVLIRNRQLEKSLFICREVIPNSDNRRRFCLTNSRAVMISESGGEA